MSYFADIPDVVVKPGNMLGAWGARAKAAAFLLAVAFYGYLLVLIKSIYLKDLRLDRLAAISMDTDKMLQNLKALDQKLAAELESLENY